MALILTNIIQIIILNNIQEVLTIVWVLWAMLMPTVTFKYYNSKSISWKNYSNFIIVFWKARCWLLLECEMKNEVLKKNIK